MKKILFSLTTTKVGRHQLKVMSFQLQEVMLVVKNVVSLALFYIKRLKKD